MTIFHKRKWHYYTAFLLLLVGLLAGTQLSEDYFRLAKNVEIFADILKELDQYYIEEVELDSVAKKGIDAMLEGLDPYTSFLSEEALEDFQTLTTGGYGGIGAGIGVHNGKSIIQLLYKDCPAQQGGIHVGDEIVQINGEDMSGQPLSRIVSLLKGMPETSVQLSVARYGVKKPLEFTLTREQVSLKNVPYHGQVEPGIGYIRLANFTTHAAEEVKSALEDLKESGVQKLILDLRGNPGGVLEEAIKVVNLFIDQHLPVVATKGKVAAWDRTYTTAQPAYDKALPMTVLIDGLSASAAEIVSGVLQDYDRALLLGTSTFGKGLVQTTRPLSYNTQLKLTTAKYYIPSGRSIQKVDYSHHRRKRLTEEVTDVPQQEFKTKAGRKVYDGNGIAPDIEVAPLSLAPVTLSLIKKRLIFDYATVFQAQHKHIQPAREFVLPRKEYGRFVAWLKDKDYAYTIEPGIDQLLQQAQGESYTEDIQKQIAALKTQVQRRKATDLQKFKAEIKLVLQEALIARYYFQEGAIEAMLSHDQAIQKACALLKDMPQYHQLLTAKE